MTGFFPQNRWRGAAEIVVTVVHTQDRCNERRMRRLPLNWLFVMALAAGCGGGNEGGAPADDGPAPTRTGGSGGRKTGGSTGSTGGSAGSSSAGGSGAGGVGAQGGSGGGSGGSSSGGSTGGGGSDASGGSPADSGAEAAPPPADDGGAPPAGDASAPTGPFTVPDGMTRIFNGKDLTGWMGSMNIWSVNAAEMAIEGKIKNSGQNIYTTATYDDFRVVLTERAMPDMDTHMGVCFWGGGGGTGYNGCLDVIPPSGAIWDYGDGGMKVNGVGSANNPIKYQWHQVEILANAATGQVLVAVNGKQSTTYTKAGRPKKGPLGLQAHAGTVHEQYKDIFIEVAPKEKRLLTVKP
jgi:hypothetical protein